MKQLRLFSAGESSEGQGSGLCCGAGQEPWQEPWRGGAVPGAAEREQQRLRSECRAARAPAGRREPDLPSPAGLGTAERRGLRREAHFKCSRTHLTKPAFI